MAIGMQTIRTTLKLTCCLVGVAAAACTTQPKFLPNDETFLQPDVPECLKLHPDAPSMGYGCCQALDFDTIGDVSKRSGQEGFPGNYQLDGVVATGKLFGKDFAFDLATNIATGQPLIAGQWIPDTENLAAIACE